MPPWCPCRPISPLTPKASRNFKTSPFLPPSPTIAFLLERRATRIDSVRGEGAPRPSDREILGGLLRRAQVLVDFFYVVRSVMAAFQMVRKRVRSGLITKR